jgi:hypothetical protein
MALNPAELKRFISEDMASDKKKNAGIGQRYYEGEHDILNCRLFYWNADEKLVEDTTRSNIKISHPFFMILSDQLSAYMLSFKDNPIRAVENSEGLQDHLDERFDDEFWAEVGDWITGSHNKGFEYLYGYKNEENHMIFQCADAMGVVEVQAKDSEDGQDHIIYHYTDKIEKGKKTVRKIQDWTKTETTYWVQVDDGEIKKDKDAPINPRPHVIFTDETGQRMGKPFGFIPFWRLDYCKKQFSGLKPVKSLIDDYDLHACSLSNNLVDFDTPLHVVKGFEGHGEEGLNKLQTNLKTKKIVGVDADGGIDVQTVDVPYQARKEKLEIDERNIYTFGMGFNPTQIGDGNITNIVIRSRYTLLDLKANKLEKRLKKLLKKIVKVVLDEINEEHGTDYQMNHVYFEFTRDIMTNETENIQNEKVKAETQQIQVNTILNVAANVGDEQTLKALCDVMEWDYEKLKDQAEKFREEQNTVDALKTLEGVVTDDETVEEVGSSVVE